jgi:hypothetical protein
MPYQWKDSPAREIILEDLTTGNLPLDNAVYSARDAWDQVYSHLIEFHGVAYEQYYRNLRSHREQVKKQLGESAWITEALVHDRELHPRQYKNARGELVFDLVREAKQYLEEDVKDKKHEIMKPAVLQKTRQIYMQFRLDIFRQRIYQEVRRQKFVFYLEVKRAEKIKKIRERRLREPQLLGTA